MEININNNDTSNNNLEMRIKEIKEIKATINNNINNNDFKSRAEKIIKCIDEINIKNNELKKKVEEVEQINGDIGSNKESLKKEVKEIKEFVNKEFVNKDKLGNDENIKNFIKKTDEITKIIDKINDNKWLTCTPIRRSIKALPYMVSAINEKGRIEKGFKIFATALSGGAAGLASSDKNDNKSLEFFKSFFMWIIDVGPGAFIDWIEGNKPSNLCRWGLNAVRMISILILIAIVKSFAPGIYEKCISPLCCKKSETTNSNNISEDQIVNTNK